MPSSRSSRRKNATTAKSRAAAAAAAAAKAAHHRLLMIKSTSDNSSRTESTTDDCISTSSSGTLTNNNVMTQSTNGLSAAGSTCRPTEYIISVTNSVTNNNNESGLQLLVEPKRSPSSSSSSLRQSVLSSLVLFVLGIFTGIVYVSHVQQHYGFGKDPAMERRYLPYGPITSSSLSFHNKNNNDSIEAVGTVGTTCVPQSQGRQTFASKQKGIILNRDISSTSQQQQSAVVSTLFGLDYNRLVGIPPSSPTNTHNDNDSTATSTTTTTNNNNNNQTRSALRLEVAFKHGISSEWYHLAATPRPIVLSSLELKMIQEVGQKLHQDTDNFEHRASQVAWGGPHQLQQHPETNWWSPSLSLDDNNNSNNDMNSLTGGQLLYSYLYIMKWNPHPHFPFRLCGDKGCPHQRALAHTLEWREKYRPWLVPPSVVAENANGYVYHRGYSPADPTFTTTSDDDIMSNSSTITGKHSIVWIRVGHHVQNDLAFFRGILNAADRAIADSLVQSNGKVGKFNVIFDCAGFSLAHTPTLQALKQGVTMLQDHYPNRLGMIFLAHLSRPGEMFLKVVLRLITKEVRDKVTILPNNNKAKSMAVLQMVVQEEYIPVWLGGTDDYKFHVDEYYPPHHRCTEEEAQEFLSTMPYHAK